MGAGGSAAVEIIDGHLKHFLLDTNPLNVEQLWDQMYTSSVFYGRRGVFAMALSSVDNALWDIVGKYVEKPVHELLGGAERDRIEIYQTNRKSNTCLYSCYRNIFLCINCLAYIYTF